MAKDFKARLEAAQKNWKKAKIKAAKPSEYDSNVEDGRYNAKIVKCEVGEAQSGRVQLVTTYQITQGESKGEKIRSYDGLETEDNLVFVGRFLAKLGYELPESIKEIIGIAKEIAKDQPSCRIRVKTNGEFQNVFLDKMVDAKDEEDSEEESEEISGDEEDEDEVPEEPEDEDDEDGEEDSEDDDNDDEEDEDEDDEESDSEDDDEESSDDDEDSDESEDEESDDDDDSDDEGVEVKKGQKVTATIKGKEVDATVLAVLEDEEKIKVKTVDGKVLKLNPDDVAVVEEEEEPKKKVSKDKSSLKKKKKK